MSLDSSAGSPSQITPPATSKARPARLVVKPKPGVQDRELDAFEEKRGITKRKVYPNMGRLRVIDVPPEIDPLKLAKEYTTSGLVEYAELDRKVQIPRPQHSQGR
jgi:hypothetical protein